MQNIRLMLILSYGIFREGKQLCILRTSQWLLHEISKKQ